MCDLHNKNKNEPNTKQLLEGLPKNWGKWGPDDEVGAQPVDADQHPGSRQ